jgi:hypothetical protein
MNHVQILHSGDVQKLHSPEGQNLHPGAPEGRFFLLAKVQILPTGLIAIFAPRPECKNCILEEKINDILPEGNFCTRASSIKDARALPAGNG